MNTAQHLQDRLHRELPLFAWECKPARRTEVPGVPFMDAIEIRAKPQGGAELAGEPVFLNSQLVERWGIDSTARMIGNEFHPTVSPSHRGSDFEWDKLAEF